MCCPYFLNLLTSSVLTSKSDIVAQMNIVMPDEVIIFPIPTNGETIPPNMKLAAPNAAEAVPAFWRSLSIASDVEAGSVMPTKNRSRNSVVS